MRTVLFKLFSAIILITCASGMWDYFVNRYRMVFEVTLPTSSQQVNSVTYHRVVAISDCQTSPEAAV